MGYKTLTYKDSVHINIYDQESLKYLKESGYIANKILQEAKNYSQPGVPLSEIDLFIENQCKKYKVLPAFKGYNGYKYSSCLSNNFIAVHGIPLDTPLRTGDVLSIDLGVIYKGHYSDNADTIEIGTTNYTSLLETARRSLYESLFYCKPGHTTGDIGFNLNKEIKRIKTNDGPLFSIVESCNGHGIGHGFTRRSYNTSIGFKNCGYPIIPGMCLCIEPVVKFSTSNIEAYKANSENIVFYTTHDKKPTAHFEKQIYITEDSYIIITD